MKIIKKSNYVLKDKKSTFIDKHAVIGDNVIIYENNRIEGECVIEDNVTLFPNSFIINSSIGKGSKIYASVIENSNIGNCSAVGPFSHIKKCVFEPHSKVGAFCEIKNSFVACKKQICSGSVITANQVVK